MPITALPTAPSKLSDTPEQFTTKADAWVAALATFTTQANSLETNVNSKEALATAAAAAAAISETNAAASAASAVLSPGTSATSTTSRTMATGSMTFTTQSGKSFVVGMKVLIAYTSIPASYFMYATVTGYSSTLLTVTVDSFVGSGTYSNWTISLTAPVTTIGSVPVGAIIPWIGGYFTNSSNGGFTQTLGAGNTVTTVNALLNSQNWYVCNGAALNVGGDIFNGAGKHLPNLTDDRFIMGDTSAGGSGGSSTMTHTHTGPSHTHTGPSHYHGTSSHALTEAELPSHAHGVQFLSATAGGLSGVNDSSYLASKSVAHVTNTSSIGSGTAHTHGNTGYSGGGYTGASGTGATGAASNSENRPLFLSCFYLMKVK